MCFYSNTTIVSINHECLVVDFPIRQNSNTTIVSINLQKADCYLEKYRIQIQLLFLLIDTSAIKNESAPTFKYNYCFY